MRPTRFAALLPLLLAACTDQPQTVVAPDGVPRFATVPNWTSWPAATALTEINTTTAVEGCPFITRSGQDLYFASNRPGGFGNLDLYVSHWDAAAKQWGTPVNLGPEINTAANEQCPLLLQTSGDLIFVSDRSGGAGGLDLWITERRDRRDDFGWEAPVNLAALNTSAGEFGPGSYEENGQTVLYFNSSRAEGSGLNDLYVSTQSRDGTFSAPTPAAGLNTSFEEQFASLSKNGLEIFFSSNRTGTLGGLDLWYATRASTSDAWGTAVNLGSAVNSTFAEGRSGISWDGTTLFFHSNRAGTVDLYETTRARTNNH